MGEEAVKLDAAPIVEDLLRRIGIEDQVSREAGAEFPTWTLTIGSATVAVQAAGEQVVVSSNLLELPGDDVGLFHSLLNANVHLHGAFFALDKRGLITVCQMRSAHGLTETVFRFLLGNVGSIADDWDDRLKAGK
jgi:hypothetical protein